MTAAISKEFTFSASHQLSGLPADHPCSRLHGHNYTVRLTLEGVPDEVGFVVDYRRLEPFKRWLDEKLDHRHLNDVFDADNPTAENIAEWLVGVAVNVLNPPTNVLALGVAVSETPKTWASVRRVFPVHVHDRALVAREDLDKDRYRWGL